MRRVNTGGGQNRKSVRWRFSQYLQGKKCQTGGIVLATSSVQPRKMQLFFSHLVLRTDVHRTLETCNWQTTVCSHGLFHAGSDVDYMLESMWKPCRIIILLFSMGIHTIVYTVNYGTEFFRHRFKICDAEIRGLIHILNSCKIHCYNVRVRSRNLWVSPQISAVDSAPNFQTGKSSMWTYPERITDSNYHIILCN